MAIDPFLGGVAAAILYKSGYPSKLEQWLREGYIVTRIGGSAKSFLGLSKQDSSKISFEQRYPTLYDKFMEAKQIGKQPPLPITLFEQSSREVGKQGYKFMRKSLEGLFGDKIGQKLVEGYETVTKLFMGQPIKKSEIKDTIPKEIIKKFKFDSYDLITKSKLYSKELSMFIGKQASSMDSISLDSLIDIYTKSVEYRSKLEPYYDLALHDKIRSFKELRQGQAYYDSLYTATQAVKQTLYELTQDYPKYIDYSSEAITFLTFLLATYLTHKTLKPVKKTIKIIKAGIDLFRRDKDDKGSKGI